MQLSETSRHALRRALDILTLAGGIVLLIAVSWEIILGNHHNYSHWYMAVQFMVCVFFLLDFFVRWAADENRSRFFIRNLWFFLISVPYLNIFGWADLPRDLAMLIGIMPLVRAFLAIYVVVRWLVATKVQQLLTAYMFTVILLTYISALVFFDFEVLVNKDVHGFGDALWWACMNVTTVGAEIFPVTAVGKVICVVLPILGMMMFPIFTTYILSFYQDKKGANEKKLV